MEELSNSFENYVISLQKYADRKASAWNPSVSDTSLNSLHLNAFGVVPVGSSCFIPAKNSEASEASLVSPYSLGRLLATTPNEPNAILSNVSANNLWKELFVVSFLQ